MPAPISAAHRALALAQVDTLVAAGESVQGACALSGVKYASYYRWKAEAERAKTPQPPKERARAGRKPKFGELTDDEVAGLRFWSLVKGSIPLAVEFWLNDPERPARPGLKEAIWAHWQAFVTARKPVTWPLSIQRACRVTEQERAEFHGKKHASDQRGTERRGGFLITAEGEQMPLSPGAIWESDDMSLNDPFRFTDPATGREQLGRQALFTIDTFSLFWLGCSHIGRARDAYRAEDIADHFADIVDQHGLPLCWRIERGRWDNNFIFGCLIGYDAEGSERRWGGLDEIIHIRQKHTSQGKANVEGGFDLLQALMDHGADGSTLSIGRERGQFEQATKLMLRANRDRPDTAALAKFHNIADSAEAVARAMNVFNHRPKQRHIFGNETRIPADLWAQHQRRPLDSAHRWRFLPQKRTARIYKGIIETRVTHYAQSFRFQVHGSPRCPGFIADEGHEVLIAFHPARPWEGCHVFNADTSARNRDGLRFGERIGLADFMEDAPQEDLRPGARSHSRGQKIAASRVRSTFRGIVAGSDFVGRRRDHAQDDLGNQLTRQTLGTVSNGGEAPPPDLRSFSEEGPALRSFSEVGPASRHRAALIDPEDLDEAEEAAALASAFP